MRPFIASFVRLMLPLTYYTHPKIVFIVLYFKLVTHGTCLSETVFFFLTWGATDTNDHIHFFLKTKAVTKGPSINNDFL